VFLETYLLPKDSVAQRESMMLLALSDFKDGSFGKNNGLEIVDGPLAGLHSRVLIVTDSNGTVLYTEQVGEIADEPNYEAALAVIFL
jgi:thiol peroxidase